MNAMQIFYQTNIVGDQTTPFSLLAESDPIEFFADDFIAWDNW